MAGIPTMDVAVGDLSCPAVYDTSSNTHVPPLPN